MASLRDLGSWLRNRSAPQKPPQPSFIDQVRTAVGNLNQPIQAQGIGRRAPVNFRPVVNQVVQNFKQPITAQGIGGSRPNFTPIQNTIKRVIPQTVPTIKMSPSQLTLQGRAVNLAKPIVTNFVKSVIYNPDTKQVLPNSPLRKSAELSVIEKKYGLQSPEFKKAQFDMNYNTVLGLIGGSTPKPKPQAISTMAEKASQTIKIGRLSPRDKIAATIDEKIDLLMENSAGYSTKAPSQIGEKGAGLYTGFMRKQAGNVSTAVEKGLASGNPLIRNASAALHGFFRELGSSPTRTKAALGIKGELAVAKQRPYDVAESVYELLGKDPLQKSSSLKRIYSVLDPSSSNMKVSVKSLTEDEYAAYTIIRQGLDLVHDISYANGHITHKKYMENLGKYTPRMYKEFEMPEEVAKFARETERKMRLGNYKKRGDIDPDDLDKVLQDPVYGMSKLLSIVQSNAAIKKYTDFVASQPHMVSDVMRPGFTKLSTSPTYGSLSGKYVLNSAAEDIKGYFFASEGVQHLYDAFRAYDRLPPRQLQKKLLTIFNPTTNLGNITSNNVFGFLIDVDPLTLNRNIAKLRGNRQLFKRYNDYLISKGISGTDISRVDFTQKAATIESLALGKTNALGKFNKAATGFYGGVDDYYKAAALKSKLDQGFSLDEATKLVSDGFQNYSSVGKFYDLFSKTPLIGQPFIKFQGDLMRIIKNAAINRPMHLIAFLGILEGISVLASKASGETDEERIAREGRFGVNRIPGLNIPLAWQTPIGEIDVARYMSPYFATNLGNEVNTQAASKVIPFMPDITFDNEGKFDARGTFAKTAKDPMLAPLAQLLADRDFRNKPISDPKADKRYGSDLTGDEQNLNRAKWLGRAYLPPLPNDVIDVGSVATGGKDRYGRTKTMGQALARLGGIKIQEATPEIVKESLDKSAYFETNNEIYRDLKASKKNAYDEIFIKQINGDEDFVTRWRDKQRKATLMLEHPDLVTARGQILKGVSEKTGQPLDPFYDLTPSQQRVILNLQAMNPKDPEEKAIYEEHMEWLKPYWDKKSEYFDKLKSAGVFDSTAKYESMSFPTSQAIRDTQDAYFKLPYGTGERTTFIAAHPELKAYWEEKAEYENNQRILLGLPPIESGFSAGGSGGGFTPWGEREKKVRLRKISIPKATSGTNIRVKAPPKIKIPKSPKLKAIKTGGAIKVKNLPKLALTDKQLQYNIKIKA